MFDWKNLLKADTEIQRSAKKETDFRSPFESDYDRIVFSSPFRRLQDKAQVFPLEKNDFVRTRLTHSMEVAALARSMGISIEDNLIKKGRLDEKYKGYIPLILESAGLAHDLGNPPFGHFGEETIKSVFKEYLKDKDILSEIQKADFCNFDGNCQTIRILTRLQCLGDEYGMHITYATLATLMKYPMDSLRGNKDDNIIFHKKFGYFQSEKECAEKVLTETELKIQEGDAIRHPLAFVLEAADDIAYSAADLEDGFKKCAISTDDILNAFKQEKENNGSNEKYIEEIISKLQAIMNSDTLYSSEKKVQQIRIYLQGEMIAAVIKAFDKYYDSIIDGKFGQELLLVSSAKDIRKTLKNLATEYILSDSEIQKTELAGASIIKYLLEYYLEALATDEFINYIKKKLSNEEVKLDKRTDRIYNTISVDYKNVFTESVRKLLKQGETADKQIYYYIYLMITDYISCMTDNYCVDLYRRLQGISIH